MDSVRSEIHIIVFVNGCETGGARLAVQSTLEDTLQGAGALLNVRRAKKILTKNGLQITNVASLHDGDIVYISSSDDQIGTKSTATAESSDVPMMLPGDWITLNVGGRLFTTTRSTLTTKEPDSMLARMFAGSGTNGRQSWQSAVDASGAYLIDRSPSYFEPILNYLRSGELVVDIGTNSRGVLAEAKFYGIVSLIDLLEAKIRNEEPASDNTPFTRRSLIAKLIGTPPDWELRCQGVNFEGANLSKLDMRHVNFKYAVLHDANLSLANLSFCNFERADLSGVRMDGANLLGVKMLCANLERASMRGCNFEDPAGSHANMEGANMKQVDLEGSHMAGVNLRVATLKNANLQNCDLRGAVLAGADLENCDLSGCDLQEANLRGANLKGAAFELMLNPLHMSQAVR